MCLLGVLALAGTPGRALARAPAGPDIRLERDPRPGALSSPLAVNVKVIVTEPGTGSPPAGNFEVYAFADQAPGTQTEIFPCAQESDNNPDVPRGVYVCTVLLDHGGPWRFHGVVNRFRVDPDDPPVPVGRTTSEFDIDTDEVAAEVADQEVKGSVAEVALLWGHTGAAGAWFLAVALAGVLALPAFRLRLSGTGLHRLEERFGLIVRATWAATGGLVASGTYLLLNQTAYDTPFSRAGLDAVFRLPYGKPYFLALAGKLGLYAVMVVASAVVLREARRRLRAGAAMAPAVPEAPSPWRATPAAARAGALVLVTGAAGVSLSVTLLKYFHELIEAARALL